MNGRCRLCAECSVNNMAIFENVDLCTKIFRLFQVKICARDDLPTSLCNKCYDMVEKVWSFNSQVQKAQEILKEIVYGVANTLSNDDCLENQTGQVVSMVQNEIIDNQEGSMVEFHYLDSKNILKCDYPNDGGNISEESVQSHCEKRKNRTKKKSFKKKQEIIRVVTMPDIEFSLNEDGSVVPKNNPEGWDSYPWTCCDCDLVFSLAEELKEHWVTTHEAPARFICADCSKTYTKYGTFVVHVRQHRPHLTLTCDLCLKWFTTAEEQENHRVNRHSDERPHTCATCGKKFRMQSALLVHVRSHLPADIKNRYQCDECPKKFGTKPNLMAHKRIHSGVRAFTCDQCGKGFIQKGNLDNHLLTHTAARPYSCAVCSKSFKTSIRLRKHASVHSGLKPHKCDVCGREFRERGTLKEHIRIHTGAMPFTCEFCGKSFRFKGVLTTHRRQHTGERPYSCDECQHHFTNWPNYNKHMKRRHGINTSATCRTKQEIPPTGMPANRERPSQQPARNTLQSQQVDAPSIVNAVGEQFVEQQQVITETYIAEPAQFVTPAPPQQHLLSFCYFSLNS
nr:unnamed protein product [Callosobruchus chinensis]